MFSNSQNQETETQDIVQSTGSRIYTHKHKAYKVPNNDIVLYPETPMHRSSGQSSAPWPFLLHTSCVSTGTAQSWMQTCVHRAVYMCW